MIPRPFDDDLSTGKITLEVECGRHVMNIACTWVGNVLTLRRCVVSVGCVYFRVLRCAVTGIVYELASRLPGK